MFSNDNLHNVFYSGAYKKMSPTAKVLYCILSDLYTSDDAEYVQSNGTLCIAVKREVLMDAVGIGKDALIKAKKELVERGLIIEEVRNALEGNLFCIFHAVGKAVDKKEAVPLLVCSASSSDNIPEDKSNTLPSVFNIPQGAECLSVTSNYNRSAAKKQEKFPQDVNDWGPREFQEKFKEMFKEEFGHCYLVGKEKLYMRNMKAIIAKYEDKNDLLTNMENYFKLRDKFMGQRLIVEGTVVSNLRLSFFFTQDTQERLDVYKLTGTLPPSKHYTVYKEKLTQQEELEIEMKKVEGKSLEELLDIVPKPKDAVEEKEADTIFVAKDPMMVAVYERLNLKFVRGYLGETEADYKEEGDVVSG